MKISHDYRNAKPFLKSVVCLAALLTVGITAHGQGGGAVSNRSGMRDVGGSEVTLTALESETKRTKRDAQSIMAEVNADFERLRAISEELKTAVASSTELNYKGILDNAVEIKKRGTRLKSNLAALPATEKQEKQPKDNVPVNDAEMRGLLATTNELLTSFLTNPIFSDMGSLDNQLAIKARHDLDRVIALSDVVRNGADKLSKRKT